MLFALRQRQNQRVLCNILKVSKYTYRPYKTTTSSAPIGKMKLPYVLINSFFLITDILVIWESSNSAFYRDLIIGWMRGYHLAILRTEYFCHVGMVVDYKIDFRNFLFYILIDSIEPVVTSDPNFCFDLKTLFTYIPNINLKQICGSEKRTCYYYGFFSRSSYFSC